MSNNTTIISNEDLASIDAIISTLSHIAYEWAPDTDEDLRKEIISSIDEAVNEFSEIFEKITKKG